MQDAQKPNPTILSREYIISLIRRLTLYSHHQPRHLLSPLTLSLGKQGLFPAPPVHKHLASLLERVSLRQQGLCSHMQAAGKLGP